MKKTLLVAALAPVLYLATSSLSPASPVLGTATATVAPVESEARWFADYDEAVLVAKKEGKDLLVDFTGSDWCGWCIRLHEEVFDHAEWIDAASKDYVFVALDFPNSDELKAAVPNPERNEELKGELGVKGFPTIFLMKSDGTAYARMGYAAGGPAGYLKLMVTAKEAADKVLASEARFEGAEEGEAKWAAWDELAAAYTALPDGSPLAGVLAEHIRWAYAADEDGSAGKKIIALKALLTKGLADAEQIEFARTSDPENKQGLLELIVSAQFQGVTDGPGAKAAVAALEELNAFTFQDSEAGFMMNFTAARWCAGPLDDQVKKAAFGKKAMELGSKEEGAMEALKKLLG